MLGAAGDPEGVGDGGGAGEGAFVGHPAGGDGALVGGGIVPPVADVEAGRDGGDVLAEVGVGEVGVRLLGDGEPGVEVLPVGAAQDDRGRGVGEGDLDGDVGVGDVERDGEGREAPGGVRRGEGGGGGGDGGEGGREGGRGLLERLAIVGDGAVGRGGADAEAEDVLLAGLVGGLLLADEVVRGPGPDGGLVLLQAQDALDVDAPDVGVGGGGEHLHLAGEEGILVAALAVDAVGGLEDDAGVSGLPLAEIDDEGVGLDDLLAVVVRLRDVIGGAFDADGLVLVDVLAAGGEGAEDVAGEAEVVDAGEEAGDGARGIGEEGALDGVDRAGGVGLEGAGEEGGSQFGRVAGGLPVHGDVGGGVPLGGGVAVGAAAEGDLGAVAAGVRARGLEDDLPAAVARVEGIRREAGGGEVGGGRGGAHEQVVDGDGAGVRVAAGGGADNAEAAVGAGGEGVAEADGEGLVGVGEARDAGDGRPDLGPGGGVEDLDVEARRLARGGAGAEGGLEGDGGDAVRIDGGDEAGEGAPVLVDDAEEVDAVHAAVVHVDDAAVDFPGRARHRDGLPVVDGAPAAPGGVVDRAGPVVSPGGLRPEAGVAEGLLAPGVLDV